MGKVDVVADGGGSASTERLRLRDVGPSSGIEVIDPWIAEAILLYTDPEPRRVSLGVFYMDKTATDLKVAESR